MSAPSKRLKQLQDATAEARALWATITDLAIAVVDIDIAEPDARPRLTAQFEDALIDRLMTLITFNERVKSKIDAVGEELVIAAGPNGYGKSGAPAVSAHHQCLVISRLITKGLRDLDGNSTVEESLRSLTARIRDVVVHFQVPFLDLDQKLQYEYALAAKSLRESEVSSKGALERPKLQPGRARPRGTILFSEFADETGIAYSTLKSRINNRKRKGDPIKPVDPRPPQLFRRRDLLLVLTPEERTALRRRKS